MSEFGALLRSEAYRILVRRPSYADLRGDAVTVRRRDTYTCIHESAHYLHSVSHPDSLAALRTDQAPVRLVDAAEFVADYATLCFIGSAGEPLRRQYQLAQRMTGQEATVTSPITVESARDRLRYLARVDLQRIADQLGQAATY